MKKLILLSLCISSIFANETFEKNTKYTCINTHNIQQGQRMNINQNEASQQLFVFTIKEDKLITDDNVMFDFKMKKGVMTSYSNVDYMLLLTPKLQIGLVPKKARGSVQYYFSCTSN